MGKWVTINGTHVYIEDGQSVEDALAKLSENSKPKREKLYSAKHWYHDRIVIPESKLDDYKDYTITELDLTKQLDYIDSLDLDSESIPNLRMKILREFVSEPDYIRKYLISQLNERVAEHQESLAKEFLKNAPKHNDVSVEESLVSVNQEHYNWSKSQNPESPDFAAYTYNCQRCAQAFILRYCHGYDVTARPAQRIWNDKKKCFDLTGDDVKMDRYATKNKYNYTKYGNKGSGGYNAWERIIFNSSDVKRTLVDGEIIASEVGYSGTEDQLRYIKKKVKESGDKSAWVCSVCWKGTRTDDGTYSAHVFCIINDGGKVKFIDPQNGEECSKYFTEKQIVPKKTEIFRADNCRLNGTMMKEVVTYDEDL